MQLHVKINFIDFKAAFDSVHKESLWKVFQAYGILVKMVNMKNTYGGSDCCVNVDGEIKGWSPVTAGINPPPLIASSQRVRSNIVIG